MCRNFELRSEHVGEEMVLAVVGELDLATAPHFRRAVGGLLGSEGRLLIVDFAETDFIDSSGLGALIWALFRVRAAGGDMVVVNAQPTLVQIIHRAGLDDLVPLETTLEDGCARLQAADVSTPRIASGSRAAHSAL